ncbi:DmpA family aminopeptidase [Pseudohaliea rubra]|uniref:D-Aminopeptidase n=1 Tax=Pseudohaliea rubra DSM 19751 TaxID=1265313 RepID=A0A095VSE3_9GAMM|nr:P1 family peptidase [Pseudohaliea rubra]KGE04382.1 D-Aminopeptidase [Pseudohaliea rubra DSM 19751]
MIKTPVKACLSVLLAVLLAPAQASEALRARDLGIPFDGEPGPLNAITDVTGVLVGHSTLIKGTGKRVVGEGPVRTGVTAVLPRGRDLSRMVAAGRAVINGTGEMTGSWLIDETGYFGGPVMLTGTTSVGMVHHATARWLRDRLPPSQWIAGLIPVVTETLDSHLNDVWGFHVQAEHVFHALDSAQGGTVAEGNVGGGTGMIAFAFKGGIGTASRRVPIGESSYTVGVLLQANHGKREDLLIAGVPVGREIGDLMPTRAQAAADKNSLVIILATDAPLTATQLRRLARRAALGVGRGGSIGGYMSGELALAFSTGNTVAIGQQQQTLTSPTAWHGEALNGLFKAAVQATEEALVNSLVAAETMTGADGLTVFELPEARLQSVLKRYNRLSRAPARTPGN